MLKSVSELSEYLGNYDFLDDFVNKANVIMTIKVCYNDKKYLGQVVFI